MATIAEVRAQYPQYSDMSDTALADALYKKFYSDLPRADFDAKIGLKAEPVKTGADLIPGQRVQAPPAQTTAPRKGEGGMLGETLGGLIETPVAVAANLVSGPVTYLAGALGPEAQRKVAGAIQYGPRTQMAQQALEVIGQAAEAAKLPPYMPASNLTRAAAPGVRAIGKAAGEEAGLIRESVQAPLAARAEKTQLQRVRESQINAPRIDAAKDALELGIALDPAVSNPTKSNILKSRVVGTGNLDAKLAEQNLPKYTAAAKRDLGLSDTVKLDAKAFEQARSAPEISKPYETVRGMQSLAPDDTTFTQLDALRATPLVGDMGQAAAANSLLDAVKQQLSAGVDGRTLVDSIRQRRREAQAIYNQQSKGVNPPSPEALAKADMNMGVANVLESMIENNITNNPTLLGDFRNARAAMAKTYDYERATNFATGNIDPQVIAKMAAEGKPMSGLLAKIGNVAANFPEVSRADVTGKTPWGEKLTRSSPGGTVGALAGSVFGLPGSIAGGVAGAVTGNILTAAEARRMATPGYQAKHAVPKDYRPPVNNLRPAEINYGPNQLVPFDPSNAVLPPGYTPPYQPNFVMQGPGRAPTQGVWDPVTQTFKGAFAPEVTPATPEVPRNMLGYSPEAPVQGQPRAFEIMRERERALSMRRGQEAEAQAAAAEAAAPRVPARGGVEYTFDAAGNLVPVQPSGTGGVLPTSLERAVEKLSGQVIEQPSTTYKTMTISPKSGAQPYTRIIKKEGETTFERGVPRAFDLTAEERIAWNKAKADFETLGTEYAKLDDKAIAQKMMDRKWVEGAITKARQQEQAFADIAARAKDERMRQDALAKREQMMDLLDTLEAQYSRPRPTSVGGQGPKTRAAIRNQLMGGEKKNNLAP